MYFYYIPKVSKYSPAVSENLNSNCKTGQLIFDVKRAVKERAGNYRFTGQLQNKCLLFIL